MGVYVYIYIYIWVCMYIYIHMGVYIYIYIIHLFFQFMSGYPQRHDTSLGPWGLQAAEEAAEAERCHIPVGK